MSDSVEEYPLRVPGFAGSGQLQDVVSPYSGKVIARGEQADGDAVETAMRLATDTFRNEREGLPPHRRAEILEDLAAQMKIRHEELSLTIAQEGGKPLKDARVEVTRAINTVGGRRRDQSWSRTRRQCARHHRCRG